MKRIAAGSGIEVAAGGGSLTSSSGAVLLLRTAAVVGLDAALSHALSAWRPAGAVHDPGKTVLDLALAVALGGDCLADVSLLRAQPELFGPVASDPTVSRLLDRLALDADAVVAAQPGRGGRARRGRHRRVPGRLALGQGGRDAHLQAGFRVPPDAGLRRPRVRRDR